MKKQFLIMKIRKHLFYAMLVAVFFCGCHFAQQDGTGKDSVFKIDEIEISNTKDAVYTISSRDIYNKWGFMFEWTDSIGKFNVGDTVVIAKKHCH